MPKVSLLKDEVGLGAQAFNAIISQYTPQWAVFHYTNQKGFLGILDREELWATQVQYMNDAREWSVAIDLAKSVLKKRLPMIDDESGKRLVRDIVSDLRAIADVNVCSVSFCCDPDLLSQWRGYAGADGGFAIGFRAGALHEIARRDGGLFGHCIYEEAKQAVVIDGMIDDALGHLAKMDQPTDFNISRLSLEFRRALVRYGAFFKDCNFRAEDEWRLVTWVMDYQDENFCFRPGKSMLTPYYKISLREGAWVAEIVAVTVGPCPHPQLAKLAVDGLLQKHQLSAVKSKPSAIPYRNW
jgi:hypothetical protein